MRLKTQSVLRGRNLFIQVGFSFLFLNLFSLSFATDCKSCHEAQPNSPIHHLLLSKHGDKQNPKSPQSKGQCISCHGDSEKHKNSPLKFSPEVSFGPRWMSKVEEQNQSCLSCHADNKTHISWINSSHNTENLTCANCHDSHSKTDKVLNKKTQVEVCTTCHKVQKSGIHALESMTPKNPKCTLCHDPHNRAEPQFQMLTNHSQGCRQCHDLSSMNDDSSVSNRAKSYHRVMNNANRTCIDCHVSVAHIDKKNFAQLKLGGQKLLETSLFYPGEKDRQWLLENHPGSQSLRQGRNCQQCHLGESQALSQGKPAQSLSESVKIRIETERLGEYFQIRLFWLGSDKDNQLSIMFDNGGNKEFTQLGCFSACHADLPGMSKDRDQGLSKYLNNSLKQERQIGMPKQKLDQAELDQLFQSNQYVSLWQIPLNPNAFSEFQAVIKSRILDAQYPNEQSDVSVKTRFNNGEWQVVINRPLKSLEKTIVSGAELTFAVALHGDGQSGRSHWVSLPMTLSVSGQDTQLMMSK